MPPKHSALRRAAAALAMTLIAPLTASQAVWTLPDAQSAPPFGVPPNYRLVWADEFAVNGLPDPAKWDHDTSRNRVGWHNRELQYYAGSRATNAVVRGGRLVITARRETPADAADWGGQRYTSARLLTRGRAEWTYGFFEIRARMPCGQGTWPAIWTLGSGGRWPEDGELDIMEHLGHDPKRVSSAVHVAAGHGGQATVGASPVADACRRFHRYQMHWTAEGVAFGVDGFMHLRYPRLDGGPRVWPFDAPQFLLLNIAIGGDLGGRVDDRIFPVRMEVDYVRVYQPAPKAASTPP